MQRAGSRRVPSRDRAPVWSGVARATRVHHVLQRRRAVKHVRNGCLRVLAARVRPVGVGGGRCGARPA
eukprot:54955-Prymnesium_polylepis.1